MFLNSSSNMRARRLQEAFTRSILPFWNSGERFGQPKRKDTCWLVKRLFIVVCSWDPIIAGFKEKFLRFKTQKWMREFVFFRRCHRWVSGASVVYLLFLQESSSLFFVGFIVVVKEIYTSVACDIGNMFLTYNLCFLQLSDRCFSCTMIRKLFSRFLSG